MPKRLVAFAIDMVFIAMFAVMLHLLLRALTGSHLFDLTLSGWTLEGIAVLTLSLPTWLYFIGFESSPRKATPGKMLLHLMVTDDDGGPLKRSRVVLRTFVKMFPLEAAYLTFFLPTPWFSSQGRGEFRFGAFLVVGMSLMYLLMTTWNDEHQSMHDLIAEAFVVDKGRRLKL